MFNFVNVLKDPNSWVKSGRHVLSGELSYKHHKRYEKPAPIKKIQYFIWGLLLVVAVIPSVLHYFGDYGISYAFATKVILFVIAAFILFNILVGSLTMIMVKKSAETLDVMHSQNREKTNKTERKHARALVGMTFDLTDLCAMRHVPKYSSFMSKEITFKRRLDDSSFQVEIIIKSPAGTHTDLLETSLSELQWDVKGGLYRISKDVSAKLSKFIAGPGGDEPY